jgi:hypothetical protein
VRMRDGQRALSERIASRARAAVLRSHVPCQRAAHAAARHTRCCAARGPAASPLPSSCTRSRRGRLTCRTSSARRRTARRTTGRPPRAAIR